MYDRAYAAPSIPPELIALNVRDMIDLSGRVAVVTGGSRGLGFSMAAALADMGARVAITARKAAELADARAALDAQGHDVAAFVSDLSLTESTALLIDAITAQLGPIDILVNNAGTSWGAPAEDYPLDAWQRIIDLNLTGTWHLTQLVANRCMIPRRHGRIINIASIAALRGSTTDFKAVAYNTSKGGLLSLTRALAGEWGIHGITVNAICPGFIPSKMSRALLATIGDSVIAATPLHQLGNEDDMKGIVVLLAGEAGRHITGQFISVDGGISAV